MTIVQFAEGGTIVSPTFPNNTALKWLNAAGTATNILMLNGSDNLFLQCQAGKAIYIARSVGGGTTGEIALFGDSSGAAGDTTYELFIDSETPVVGAQLQDSPEIKLRAGVWNSGFAADGSDYICLLQQIDAETAGGAAAREGKMLFKFGTYDSEASFMDFEMNAGPAYVINLSQDIDIASGKVLKFTDAGAGGLIKSVSGEFSFRNKADAGYASIYMAYSVMSMASVYSVSNDLSAGADQVLIGGYEISAGHRALCVSTEEVVVAAAAGASDAYVPIRYNGVTYKLLLHT